MVGTLSIPRRLLAVWARRQRQQARRRAQAAESRLPAGAALAELPLAMLDTEATGLNPLKDRVLAIGGLHWRNDAAEGPVLNLLVCPERPVPAASTAVHGITGAMVASAPPFRAIAGSVQLFWRHRVLVGHNIGYDLALLRQECERAGQHFQPPAASLDIGLLYAALHPRQTSYTLEGIAAHLAVEVRSRHDALGDAATAAALWKSLRPLLGARGIATLGAARQAMRQPRDLVFQQGQAGWAMDLVLPHD